jgi:hypothetical protein
MKTPIEQMLDRVQWTPREDNAEHDGSLPYATHSGVLTIAGYDLQCYRLSDGQTVFDADDFRRFFSDFFA